jgi:hypothetical protein
LFTLHLDFSSEDLIEKENFVEIWTLILQWKWNVKYKKLLFTRVGHSKIHHKSEGSGKLFKKSQNLFSSTYFVSSILKSLVMSENILYASILHHPANGYHEFTFGTTENKFWRAENISYELESCPDEAVLFVQIFLFMLHSMAYLTTI